MLRAALAVEGDAITPELITGILGRTPDQMSLKGQLNKINPTLRHRTNRYTYRIPGTEGHFGTEGISSGLTAIGPEAAKHLGYLKLNHNALIALSIWQEIDESTRQHDLGIHIDADAVQILAVCHASIDIDQSVDIGID